MEGEALWEYLLSKAILHNELPDPMNVQDWTSKDIGKLPAKDQWAWHKAQFEELEALKNIMFTSLQTYLLAERKNPMVLN